MDLQVDGDPQNNWSLLLTLHFMIRLVGVHEEDPYFRNCARLCSFSFEVIVFRNPACKPHEKFSFWVL